jgi:hypothetical protein
MKENKLNNCLCCAYKITANKPRTCPICYHVFKGLGWEGMDAHWKAKHEDIMAYNIFWDSLCLKHK